MISYSKITKASERVYNVFWRAAKKRAFEVIDKTGT